MKFGHEILKYRDDILRDLAKLIAVPSVCTHPLPGKMCIRDRYNLKKVFYVGDTQGDADACQKADVPFILADSGFGNTPAPAYRIAEPKELLTDVYKRQV